MVECRGKHNNIWLRQEGMTVNVSQWRMEGLSRIVKPCSVALTPLTVEEDRCRVGKKNNARCDGSELQFLFGGSVVNHSTMPLPPSLTCSYPINELMSVPLSFTNPIIIKRCFSLCLPYFSYLNLHRG